MNSYSSLDLANKKLAFSKLINLRLNKTDLILKDNDIILLISEYLRKYKIKYYHYWVEFNSVHGSLFSNFPTRVLVIQDRSDSDKINKYVSDYLEKDDDKIDECDLLWEENLGFNKLPGELVIESDEYMGPVIVYDNMASQMVVQYLKHNIQKILKENNMVNIFRMIFNVQYNNTLFKSCSCKDELIINPFDEVFDSFMFSNM